MSPIEGKNILIDYGINQNHKRIKKCVVLNNIFIWIFKFGR